MFDNKARIKDLQITLDGQHILSLSVPASIKIHYDELKEKDLRLELKPWRERRSLDANAYFHVLVGKIAEKVGISAEQCKINMVLDYGTIARDEDGFKVGMMVNKGADINKMYKYAKPIGTRTVNGTEVDCYMVYEHTSLYDSAQMANLINGVIQEAQELGIETMTPAEQAKLLSLWGSKNA